MGKHRRKSFQIDPKRAARVITVLGVTGAILLTIFYWLFYQPGRKTHEHLVSPQTRLRLSFQPAIIQDYLSSLAPGVTRFVSVVPKFTSMQARAFRIDWIHALPYEITFLADAPAAGPTPLTLYVNPIPDNNSFVGEVNAWGALRRMPVIQWQSGQLSPAGPQQHTAKGDLPLPPTAAATIAAWPQGPGGLAPFSRRHFLDLAADNHDGILLALHAAFRDTLWAWTTAETDAALEQLWPSIARAELTADLTRNDELTLNLSIELRPGTDLLATAELITTAATELGQALADDEALTLTGQVAITNNTLTGTYRLTGFQARIQRASH